MNDCSGCDNPSPTPRRYIMVEATASQANDCGDPTNPVTAVSSCARQEPTFDIILNGFILPEEGLSTNVNVCNVNVYVEGLYIEFPTYGVVMLIESVSPENRSLTLKNACRNGNSLENPDAGTGITKNSIFIVTAEPPCLTTSEGTASVTSALASMTELCMPALLTGNATAVYEMVGQITSDPSDTAQGPCIKKVSGFGFQEGAPVTPSIELIPDADSFLYREVAERKTTGAYKARRTPGEWTGTANNSKYVMAGSKTAYKAVGPAFFYSPFYKVFETKNTALDNGTYTALAKDASVSRDFSVAIPEVTGLFNKDLQDHYYLNIHVMVGMFGNSGGGIRYFEVELNGVVIGYTSGTNAGINSFLNITYPIKVLNTDVTFNFKITARASSGGGGGLKYFYKVSGLGAFI